MSPTTIIAGLVLGGALALAGFQAKQAADARAETAKVRADFSDYRAKAVTDQAAAVAAEQAKGEAARSKIQEAQDAAFKALKVAEVDAARDRATAGQLRARAKALASAARCSALDSSATPGSEAASAPADLLADMLGRTDEAASELARYADQARAAGQLCQLTYEALTP